MQKREDLKAYYQRELKYFSNHCKNFDLENAICSLNIVHAGDLLQCLVESQLRQYGLTRAAFGILIHLEAAPEKHATMQSLSERLLVTQANTTGTVDTLERHKFVLRKSCPKDRRVKYVCLTPLGSQTINRVLPKHFDFLKNILQGLTHKEKKNLATLIEKVRAQMCKLFIGVILMAAGLSPAQAQPLKMKALAEYVAAHHPSVLAAKQELVQAQALEKLTAASYDPSLYMAVAHEDKREPVSLIFQPTQTEATVWNTTLSKRFPSATAISLENNFSRSKNNSTFLTLNPSYTNHLELNLRQSLLKGFLGLPDYNQRQERALAVEAAQLRLKQTEENLLLRFSLDYLALYASAERVEVARRRLQSISDFVALTERLKKIGLADEEDLLRGSNSYLERQQDLLNAQTAWLETSEQVQQYFITFPKDLQQELKKEYLTVLYPVIKGSTTTVSLADRSDLAALQLQLEQLELRAQSKSRNHLPQLDALASYGFNELKGSGSYSWLDTWRGKNPEWKLGLELLYSFGSRADYADQSLAAAQAQSLQQQIAETKQAAQYQLQQALRQWKNSGTILRIDEQLTERKNQVLEIVLRKYQQGRITSAETLRTNEELQVQELKTIASRQQHAAEWFRIQYAQGHLTEWIKNND